MTGHKIIHFPPCSLIMLAKLYTQRLVWGEKREILHLLLFFLYNIHHKLRQTTFLNELSGAFSKAETQLLAEATRSRSLVSSVAPAEVINKALSLKRGPCLLQPPSVSRSIRTQLISTLSGSAGWLLDSSTD